MSTTTALERLLSELDEQQREVVTAPDGPILVFAGAGSGKTRVLTYRIAYLLLAKRVPAHRILACTFTNKAADEMRQRLETLVGKAAEAMWLGTFHALCARMLRQHGSAIGLPSDFVIYDEDDQRRLLKAIFRELDIDTDRYSVAAVQSAISDAKTQMVRPDQLAEIAETPFGQVVARVYRRYQEALRQAKAVDFDDLLWLALEMLREHPSVADYYQTRFLHVLVDEYQDVNAIQHELALLLAAKHRNLFCVGDDDQCVVKGTKIATPQGLVRVEELAEGQEVLAACGWGKVAAMKVNHLQGKPYCGKVICLTTASGKQVRLTPNHLVFARLRVSPQWHYVYLMHRRGKGYRIGVTEGTGDKGQGTNKGSHSSFALPVPRPMSPVPLPQEVADRLWILRVCADRAEAHFWEQFFAFKYGLPTTVFHVRGRRMALTQELVDRLFRELNTERAALRLMRDLMVFEEHPHHLPHAVLRGNSVRRYVRLTMFGDARPCRTRPWHAHRINLVTSGETLKKRFALSFPVRDGKRLTWRVETARVHWDDAWKMARRMAQLGNLDILVRAALTEKDDGPFFTLQPASHLHIGMEVAVWDGQKVRAEPIVVLKVEDYEGEVYDLSVPECLNYLADGLVVHNSIYSWRGSDVRLMLSLKQRFPDLQVFTLERNYRSTQTILDTAWHVIRHNRYRHEKRLQAAREGGEPVVLFRAQDDHEEAAFVGSIVTEWVRTGKFRYSDFAVIYRINAQSRPFEETFIRWGIPYRVVGALRFYERKEVKDILAYLRLLVNPADEVSLLRVINLPPRGIGEKTVERLRQFAHQRRTPILEAILSGEVSAALDARARSAVKNFGDLMRSLKAQLETQTLPQLIQHLVDAIGYADFLIRTEGQLMAQERLENLAQLVAAAERQFGDQKAAQALPTFLEQLALMSPQDETNWQSDAVTLITAHSAKGLEFPVVFVVGLEEGLFPHARSLDNAWQLEEERRLFYVALTRAKERAFLAYAQRRGWLTGKWGEARYAPTEPSRFLNEVPLTLLEEWRGVPTPQGFLRMDAPTVASRPSRQLDLRTLLRQAAISSQKTERTDFGTGDEGRGAGKLGVIGEVRNPLSPEQVRVGMRVRHRQFGEGVIVAVEPDERLPIVVVRFDDRTVGEKRLALAYAPLEIL
jgi:DNA helicase II / ATP-dependent DNA helicase PcrA